jgi:hypothetical protein
MNSVMYLVFMFNLFSNVCTLILAAFSVKKQKLLGSILAFLSIHVLLTVVCLR